MLVELVEHILTADVPVIRFSATQCTKGAPDRSHSEEPQREETKPFLFLSVYHAPIIYRR